MSEQFHPLANTACLAKLQFLGLTSKSSMHHWMIVAGLVLLVIEGTWVLGQTFRKQYVDHPAWELLIYLLSQPTGNQQDFRKAVAAKAAHVLVDMPTC